MVNAAERSTTIKVTGATWQELNRRKQVGDSMEDVIKRLLRESAEAERESA